jgi:presenilin-like A22 family membrane protease
MLFDILLPSALFFLTAAAVFLYPKLETKVKSILEEKKFSIRDVVMLVIVMGIAVAVLVIIPDYAIRILFLIFYSLMLFLSMYIVVPKWYMALLLPIAFLALYIVLWNASPTDVSALVFTDAFAAIFVVFASVYMGTLFGWETIVAFAGLLTAMDVIQVLVTGFMVESAKKIVNLKLPVMIISPTFPYQSANLIALGLGDILLSSLLVIQTAKKYGRKFGYASAAFIAGAFLVFEFLMLYYQTGGMPATVFIDCGWLLALGVRQIYISLITEKTRGEEQ